MKKIKYLIPLFLLVMVLFGCSKSGAITTSELRSDATSLKKDLTSQQKLLKKLKKNLTATQDVYDNLSIDSEITELNQTIALRDKTVENLQKNQKKQTEIKSTFDATIKKNNTKFPNSKLKNVVQSQEIAALDAQTFNDYLDKTKKVEANITNLFDQDPIDETALKTEIDLVNRYYSALFQQLEIWQVNVVHVQTTNKSLIKSLH